MEHMRFRLFLCRRLMEGWRISLLNEKEKTIFVDADACPVKEEIMLIASQFSVRVIFVASFEHYQLSRSKDENWVYDDGRRKPFGKRCPDVRKNRMPRFCFTVFCASFFIVDPSGD